MQNCVTRWLDKTSMNFPDKVAIEDRNGKILFKELREKALKISGKLLSLGLIHSPIAVILEKSIEAVTAFLGVAYSGNFYTVIDVEMPKERVDKILKQFKPMVIICHKSSIMKEELRKVVSSECIFLNIEDCDYYDLNGSEENVQEKIVADDLLYVLFTSGSTGIPKGVTITHRSVINYIDWAKEIFDFNKEDIIGNQAPFYFDNSVLDIYTMINSGCRLEIIDKELFFQPVRLLKYIAEKKITTIFWVPSELILVANSRALYSVSNTFYVKRIIFAGEVMPTKQLNMWRKRFPDVVYANLYGPTEITVDCTYYICDRELNEDEPVPIGDAINNVKIYLLDSELKKVPDGEIGEIYVGGIGLSLGYYNDKEKTDEVFIQNPLIKGYRDIIYKTGDLGRYNDRNELIYVGRADSQIKHMGYRIELGEIEALAITVEKVESVCCIYDEEKRKIILIYQGNIDSSDLRDALRKLVPKYMIPNTLKKVNSMPFNVNGKIDRNKLRRKCIHNEL